MLTGPFLVPGANQFTRHFGQKSFLYGGSVYLVAMADYNEGMDGSQADISVWKSTDVEHWTECDSSNRKQIYPNNGESAYGKNDCRVSAVCRYGARLYVAYIGTDLKLRVSQFDLATETWTGTSAPEPNAYTLSDAMWGNVCVWPMAIAYDGSDIHVLFQPTYDVNTSLGGTGSRVAYNKLTGGVSGSWGTILRVPGQPTPADTGEAFIPVDNYASALMYAGGRVHALWTIGDKDNDGSNYKQLMQWQPGQASSTPVLSLTHPVHQETDEANLWRITCGIPVVTSIGGVVYMALMVELEKTPVAGHERSDVQILTAQASANPSWSASKVTQVINTGPASQYVSPGACCFAHDGSIRIMYHDGNGDTGSGTVYMVTRTWSPSGGLSEQSEFWDSLNWNWSFGLEAMSYWVFFSRVTSSPSPLKKPIYVISSTDPPAPSHLPGPGGSGAGTGDVICQYKNGYDECLLKLNQLTAGVFDLKRSEVLSQVPPWVKMPDQGQRFQKVGSIVLPADDGIDNLILQFRVPQGYDGTILAVTNLFDGLGFIAGNGDLEWRVRANLAYLKDQGRILINRGRLRNPWPLQGGGYRIFENEVIRMYVAVMPGAAARLQPGARIIGALTGWLYPKQKPETMEGMK